MLGNKAFLPDLVSYVVGIPMYIDSRHEFTPTHYLAIFFLFKRAS
jgi:hypothetical protein